MNAAISVGMDECNKKCRYGLMQKKLQGQMNAAISVGIDECSNKCGDR